MTPFEKALEIYIQQEIRMYDNMRTTHIFSKQFERKMEKLIRRRKKFYYPLVKSPLRRVIVTAVIILFLLSAAVMAVEPLRNGFFEMVRKGYEKYTAVVYQEIDPEVISPAEEDVFIEYEFEPPGFKIIEENINPDFKDKYVCYENKDGAILVFTQGPANLETQEINTENAVVEKTDMDGVPIICFNNQGMWNVLWEENGYYFHIYGEIDKYSMLNLAKSTKCK